jgi:hypothetical protein
VEEYCLLTVMPGTSEFWKALITSARWWRTPQRTDAPSIRCGVCWQTFIPGPDGPPVFAEERGVLLIRVCPACEKTFTSNKW